MIKFKVGDGANGVTPMIGLGLTEDNFNLLRQGKPIHIKANEIKSDVDILIFWGKDHKEILKQLKPHITNQTELKIGKDL